MPRSVPRPLLRRGSAIIGPVLLVFCSAVAGCTGETPGAGSADIAASRKVAAARGGVGFPDLKAKGGDVAPTRTRGRGEAAGKGVGPRGVVR